MNINQDTLILAGACAAFLAACLSIMDKFLSLKERLATAHPRKKEAEPAAQRAQAEEAPHYRHRAPTKVFQVSAYLLVHEITVIAAAGVLLNYLGLVLSRQLQSILYLDMTGTALAAFLLGPWWGMMVGLLSSSVVNWLLYPEPGAALSIFPWSLVNMTGGVFWGLMARRAWFRKYMRSARGSIISHVWYLTSFGVLGGCVMSIPGAFVGAAVSGQTAFTLSPQVAAVLDRFASDWQQVLSHHLQAVFGTTLGKSLGVTFVYWMQNCLWYIPDKTMTAAIALAVLKYGFPLFERELIHGGSSGKPPVDTRMAPLLVGLLYSPSFGHLVTANLYAGTRFWPLWASPWLILIAGYFFLYRRGPSDSSVKQACLARADRYARVLKPIQAEPAYEFCRRLTLATLIASVLFAVFLPILLVDFSRAAFNFFCVVYGFLLAVHLVSVAISQNLSVARANE
jgi:hypothetical protein